MADDGVVMLTICGSYQMLGHEFVTHDGRRIAGVGRARRRHPRRGRPADRQQLGRDPGCRPAGRLREPQRAHRARPRCPAARPHPDRPRQQRRDRTEGAVRDNVIGTYLHGPVLAKSPRFADDLLRRAFAAAGRTPTSSRSTTRCPSRPRASRSAGRDSACGSGRQPQRRCSGRCSRSVRPCYRVPQRRAATAEHLGRHRHGDHDAQRIDVPATPADHGRPAAARLARAAGRGRAGLPVHRLDAEQNRRPTSPTSRATASTAPPCSPRRTRSAAGSTSRLAVRGGRRHRARTFASPGRAQRDDPDRRGGQEAIGQPNLVAGRARHRLPDRVLRPGRGAGLGVRVRQGSIMVVVHTQRRTTRRRGLSSAGRGRAFLIARAWHDGSSPSADRGRCPPPPAGVPVSATQIATLHTSAGDIRVELFGNHAPKTVTELRRPRRAASGSGGTRAPEDQHRPALRRHDLPPGDRRTS